MPGKKRHRTRNRSAKSSASSEDNSPAAKRITSPDIDATRAGIPLQSDMTSTQPENLPAAEEIQEEPTRSEMWKVLIDIQANVAKILNENHELRKDVDGLKTSMEFNNEQVEKLKKENAQLVKQNGALQGEVYDLGKRVRNLEVDHDALEQYTRKFNVEVHGIPEHEGKTSKIKYRAVLSTRKRTCVRNLELFVTTFNLAKTQSAFLALTPSIVRFSSYKKKREFYQGRFHLKDINTSDIIESAQHSIDARIFINENLTQWRQELLAKARKMKKAKKISRVWTVDGKIFARKTEESRPVKISELWELEELET
ncbi:hypothetical protein ACROYT_G035484 [Oculina patagonica]